jgi:adenylate cyclase
MIVVPLELSYPGPAFGHIYKLVTIYRPVTAVAMLASTLLAYFKSPSILARQRAKVVLFGTALAFPIPAFGTFWAFFGGTVGGVAIQNNFFAIPLLVFPASIAYAIAKHDLFDVDVYIKRAVGYGIMTAVVGLTYFLMQLLARRVIFSPLFGDYAETIYPILFALVVVFLFNPINRRVQEGVDKLFFRKKFDYKETISSVSNALTSLLNLDEILRQVVHTIRTEMFVDAAGVIILQPEKNACEAVFIGDTPSNGKDEVKEVSIAPDEPLLTLLSDQKRLITKYDVEEDPAYRDVKEVCEQGFGKMTASMAIPLMYKGKVTGALAVGDKKSGHFYSREDVELLTTMANQAAVAIENAKLVEQMRREETVRTNLARYLSPQIVDQIVKKDVQVNLGGDKKVVTVLFSDIRNFTGITEARPPGELVHILNEYFTEMANIIFAHQGSLDKYIGDAIVAVFGSLIVLENSAQKAVQAAIQMMTRLPDLNERWGREYGFRMDIGIGINTGEVFLGNIGSPERMEFTVIGDTVNVASRFSGLARRGQILVTRETLSCLGGEIPYGELPPAEVKGKGDKLEVFEIIWPKV